MENKRFCDLVVGDKVYTQLEGTFFEEYKNDDVEYDIDECNYDFSTNLDTYVFTENQLNSDFAILENSDGIKLYISTSIDKLLLECEK